MCIFVTNRLKMTRSCWQFCQLLWFRVYLARKGAAFPFPNFAFAKLCSVLGTESQNPREDDCTGGQHEGNLMVRFRCMSWSMGRRISLEKHSSQEYLELRIQRRMLPLDLLRAFLMISNKPPQERHKI